jgi:hypothetical protein
VCSSDLPMPPPGSAATDAGGEDNRYHARPLAGFVFSCF